MRLGLMGGVLGAVMAAVAGSAPAVAQQGDNAWIKVCNTDPRQKKEFCQISQQLRTDAGQFLASVAIRETPGEARKLLVAAIPVGMLLQPGVQMQIDGAKAQTARYSICFPNACYAELAIDNGYISRLKRGGKLQVTTVNQQAKQVRFDMTLIGFTAAYDGPGTNPEELQRKQADLQRELERKAQEARDRLVAQQREALESAQSN
ncbi:MAG: invasion associated locus B family protein [Pseudomonadota bacterium]